ITVEGDRRQLVRWMTGGSSYLSSHDKRVLVGLGPVSASSNLRAEIRWPNGNVQKLTELKPNRYYHVVEARPAPSENAAALYNPNCRRSSTNLDVRCSRRRLG